MINVIDFTFKNRRIRIYESGEGSEILFLFHGFGQTGQVFDQWHRELGVSHRIYAFDLFFHGASDQVEEHVTIDLWKALLDHFIVKENISDFHLAGYSLGGRFVNATLQEFPNRVKSITYMAPDGFFESPWHRLAITFKPIFKWMMSHPKALIKFSDGIEKTRIVSSSMVKFAQRELRDAENRIRVYRSWVFLKRLVPPPKRIAKMINDHHIKCWVFLGARDHIIPPEKVSRHLRRANTAMITILDKRHHEIIDAAFEMMYTEQPETEEM